MIEIGSSRLYDTREVADRLHLSFWVIRDTYIRPGLIPSRLIGRKRYVSEADLEAWLEHGSGGYKDCTKKDQEPAAAAR